MGRSFHRLHEHLLDPGSMLRFGAGAVDEERDEEEGQFVLSSIVLMWSKVPDCLKALYFGRFQKFKGFPFLFVA